MPGAGPVLAAISAARCRGLKTRFSVRAPPQALSMSLLDKIRALADRHLPAHLRHARRGEDLANDYLRRHGYRIVARNFRPRSGRGGSRPDRLGRRPAGFHRSQDARQRGFRAARTRGGPPEERSPCPLRGRLHPARRCRSQSRPLRRGEHHSGGGRTRNPAPERCLFPAVDSPTLIPFRTSRIPEQVHAAVAACRSDFPGLPNGA